MSENIAPAPVTPVRATAKSMEEKLAEWRLAKQASATPFKSPTKVEWDSLKARIQSTRKKVLAPRDLNSNAETSSVNRLAAKQSDSDMVASDIQALTNTMSEIDSKDDEVSAFKAELRAASMHARREDLTTARSMFDSVYESFPLARETAAYFIARATAEEEAGELGEATDVLSKGIDSTSSMPRDEKELLVKECNAMLKRIAAVHQEKEAAKEAEKERQLQEAKKQLEHEEMEMQKQKREQEEKDKKEAEQKAKEAKEAEEASKKQKLILEIASEENAVEEKSTMAPPNTPAASAAGGFASPSATWRSPFKHVYTPRSLLPNAGPPMQPKRSMFSPGAVARKLMDQQEEQPEAQEVVQEVVLASEAEKTPSANTDVAVAHEDAADVRFAAPLSYEDTGFHGSAEEQSENEESSTVPPRSAKKDRSVAHPVLMKRLEGAPVVDTWSIAYEEVPLSESKRQKMGVASNYIITPVKRSARKGRPSAAVLEHADAPVVPNPFLYE
jgi:hypothetical protein